MPETRDNPRDASQQSAVGIEAAPPLGYEERDGPLMDEMGRQRFETFELAMALSHWDIGAVKKVTAFPRGSRKAPKLVLKTETGTYLLKRRAAGKDDPYKVAFTHGLQLHLASKGFPLPHLVGTRKTNNSILKLPSGTYELFEYIRGTGFDASLEATGEAGRVLGLFHKLLLDFSSKYQSPAGSYHKSGSVVRSLEQVPATLQRVKPEDAQSGAEVVASLSRNYKRAAKAAEDLGLSEWPAQVIHSDWHPGNLLFRDATIVAVIDYDAARLLQRVMDVANGALQFSIVGSGDTPVEDWPVSPDLGRFKRFIRGYDAVPDNMLTQAELRVVPSLMIEALIAEAAIPIAAAGQFAHMDGLPFLKMVQRKVRWLRDRSKELIDAVDG